MPRTARQEKSGEGNDLPFSSYLQKSDWHPKILTLLNYFAEQDASMMAWTYRAASTSVSSESGDPAPAAKKSKTSRGNSELAAAVRDSNEEVAAAMRDSAVTKSLPGQQQTWAALVANADLPAETRAMAGKLLAQSMTKQTQLYGG